MASEVRTEINWRGITITGLAYGGGLMAGNIVSQFLLDVISPEPYGSLGEAARLIIGILIVMLISGFGAAIGGFLGGWTLPVIGEPKGKYGFAWRSAFSVGAVYGIFLLLAVFGLSALTMRDAAFMPAGPFMKVYLLVGMIMGGLIGLLLGLTTVGWRRSGSVIVASLVGFGLGGAALGAGIWAYLSSAPPGAIYEGDYILLLIGLFGFGLFGGLAIGFAFDRLARRETGFIGAPITTLDAGSFTCSSGAFCPLYFYAANAGAGICSRYTDAESRSTDREYRHEFCRHPLAREFALHGRG